MAAARVTDKKLTDAFDEGRGVETTALKTYVILGVGDEPTTVTEWPHPIPAVAMLEVTQHLALGDRAFVVIHVGTGPEVGVVPEALGAGLALVKKS